MNNTKFFSIGTDILVIGLRAKVGTTTLITLLEDDVPAIVKGEIKNKTLIFENLKYKKLFKTHWIFDENKITVVLIRDIIGKWKSGYRTELRCCHVCHHLLSPIHPCCEDRVIFDDKTNFPSVDDIAKVHDVSGDLSWMYYHHTQFWAWNNNYIMTLEEMMEYNNIWFLDLKDLSNLKFLEWVYEKDEKWKVVKEITHDNNSLLKNPKFWPRMDLFWKDYKEGKIFKDRTLACPFYDLPGNKLVPEFEVLHKRVKQQQDLVDYIRKNHERYLRFE